MTLQPTKTLEVQTLKLRVETHVLKSTCINILLMDKILHHQGWWLSHYLYGFNHPRWCRISSINIWLCLWQVVPTEFCSTTPQAGCWSGCAQAAGVEPTLWCVKGFFAMHSLTKKCLNCENCPKWLISLWTIHFSTIFPNLDRWLLYVTVL